MIKNEGIFRGYARRKRKMRKEEVEKINFYKNMTGMDEEDRLEKLAILNILGETHGFDIIMGELRIIRNYCTLSQFKQKVKQIVGGS